MSDQFSKNSVSQYADSSRDRFESTLRDIVEIPTVSVEPEHRADMVRGARYAAQLLESMGARARVYETGGHPLVHGRFEIDPAYPTATIYNHLDVQPAEGPDWKSEPFRFVRDGDRYLGRGTTDDKGPAISALFGAKYAADNGARVNIDFLWELEEEIGSPHFERRRSRRTRRIFGPIRSSSPTRSGSPASIRPVRRASGAFRDSVSRSAPARPISTPARPAARRAIPRRKSARSLPSAWTRRPGG